MNLAAAAGCNHGVNSLRMRTQKSGGTSRLRDDHLISASLLLANLDSSEVGNSSKTRFRYFLDLTRSPVSAVARPSLYNAAGTFSLPGYSATRYSNDCMARP